MRRMVASISRRLQLLLLRMASLWLQLALAALFLYSGLPWLAPTFAKLGWSQPADFLYTLYSPFCHQFAFRSVFLFGEQAFYPRGAANSGYAPFEQAALQSDAFLREYSRWAGLYQAGEITATGAALQEFSVAQQLAARHFIGDERLGYKTSLCARDLAIYAMIFVGGLVYWRFRWRVKPMPLWLFALAGLCPIGIDGFSQWLSYPPFELWAVRETVPAFRVLTGGSFGLMCAWLGFPHIERSMQELIVALERRIGQAQR